MMSTEARSAPTRRHSTVDTTLAIVFVILLVPLGLLVTWFGGTLPVAAQTSGVCASTAACHSGELGIWLQVATVGPWIAAAAGLVATALLWSRRMLSFWVPLVTAAVMICTVVAAYVTVILTMTSA